MTERTGLGIELSGQASADLGKLGFTGVSLMDGESVDSALNLPNGAADEHDGAAEIVLLTDRRLIRLSAGGRRREATFVSLYDIEAVEVASERSSGVAGYLWGGLAFLVALLTWRVWDNPVWSGVVAGIVALMGVYLIVDYALSPAAVRATFKVGGSEFDCGLNGSEASEEINGFVNRLFALKDAGGVVQQSQSRDFAPR